MKINYNQFQFKKKFGQNFLVNRAMADKIVQCINHPEKSTIIEIGPGSGTLTKSLLATHPAHLIVIEIDKTLMQQLEDLKSNHSANLQVINNDALQVVEENFAAKKFKIVANLPYNIGTLLVIKWLKKIHLVDEIIITLQQEVANRITAKKCSKAYGRLSVLAQSLCNCKMLFKIDPENFYPQPRVLSSVIKMTPKETLLPYESIEKLEKICKIAFRHRRKKMSTNLKKTFPNIGKILMEINIKPNSRADNVSVEEFYTISQKVNFNCTP